MVSRSLICSEGTKISLPHEQKKQKISEISFNEALPVFGLFCIMSQWKPPDELVSDIVPETKFFSRQKERFVNANRSRRH